MSRMYFQPIDKLHERNVASLMLPHYDIAIPLAEDSPLDFAIYHRQGQSLMLEVRTRYSPRTQYPTLTIGKEKIDKCLDISRRCGAPFVLAVNWTDDLGLIHLTDTSSFKVSAQTRGVVRDRTDKDRDVYHIPLSDFFVIRDAGHKTQR